MAKAVDVARLAGTSTAVVSYVFNDGPRPVAAETRQRVLDAAASLGYAPNRVARSLRTSRTDLVGVLVPDITAPYFAVLGKDLEREIAGLGKLTLIGNTETTQYREGDALEAFRSTQVDGIILVWSDNDYSAPDLGTTPVVYLFHAPEGFSGTMIAADNEDAVVTAVEHLRGHGHTDIRMIAGIEDRGPVGERVSAWRRAIGDPSAEPLRSTYSNAGAAELARELMDAGTLPAAIIAATDEQAIGLLAAAYERGVRIPEDLAVISLDGSPATEFTAPPLTVLHQPTALMAQMAVRAMTGAPHKTLIPAELIVRSSCGCTKHTE
ncbi:LacI family transcriptional regulator [Mycetocola tolaasinivorans]|uniref:LacI family transcriptional regulator n=1 Tax=Mycetocola tolaasinivorans TaxID=76635 RepID=A0A3L7AAU1_9MICO|nr:LacI family DNA-binding transcriptional regulator [Mycetocola tolaasinivorans]RLP77499.1 LacI family transcriptional regulator [Mycetocola tolaasinivorans]